MQRILRTKKLCYHVRSDGSIQVGINTTFYSKELSLAIRMSQVLTESLPFGHEVVAEPTVKVLGGLSRGKLTVEMVVKPVGTSIEECKKLLEQAGWSTHFEPTLT